MKKHAPDGFTLLELLLAVSLISLITSSIMGGVHLGRRAWETNRASESLDEVESAVRATARLLERAYPIALDQFAQPTSEAPPPFLGARNGCRFVMLSEGGAQWGGLIVTEIGLDTGPDGVELAVWTTVFRNKDQLSLGRAAMKKTVVLQNVVGLDLSFFGAQQQNQAPGWSGDWNSRFGLPALVSFKIAANRLGRVVEAGATVATRQQ